jgi:hypothetical protein
MMMRHFSSEEWADFVRNTLKAKDKRAMQAHLEDGCKRCAGALAAWTRVRQMAVRESSYEPPEAAVKAMKGLIAIHGRPAPAPIAKLLFDSLLAPATAGVRSAATVARQMLYGIEDYRVDLRLEPNFDTDQVLLVGQVLNAADAEKNVGHVHVALLRSGKVLGSSKSNEFGEFHLECDLAGRLELEVRLPRGAIVRIPVVEPSIPPESEKAPQLTEAKGVSGKRRQKSKRTRK